MKEVKVRRPDDGWLEVRLGEEEVDYLWKCIDNKGISIKKLLAGNVDSSCLIEDEDDWFYDNVLQRLIGKYSSEFRNIGAKLGLPLAHPYYLKTMWVNHQKQFEFNPIHSHTGIYSFVVWMKIPTDWKDQIKLSFLRGTKQEEKKTSAFEFIYTERSGEMIIETYRLDSSHEGCMLFFPSTMCHQVYPFYNCDEDRISISGNIGIDTRKVE